MKKKLAVMALAAATLSMMAMPVYADDLVTVGYAQVGHESDWRTANTQNYQDVFSEDAGYSLDLVDCDNDNAAQLEAVRTFISKDMDYIVIAPIQSAGWDTVLQEAQDAGIPVIIADREIEASDDLYDAWVGTNTTNEGITAGNWLAEYLGDKDANILVIEGSVGASAALGRTEGFNPVSYTHLVDSAVSEAYGVAEGVLVRDVTEGGAADEAGIEAKSIITKFAGKVVTTKEQLVDFLSYYEPGEDVELTIEVPDGKGCLLYTSRCV